MTRSKSHYEGQVLVLQGSPHGWCPLHCFEVDARCGAYCWQTRVDAARAAHDLEDYFNSLYGLGWHWHGARSQVA